MSATHPLTLERGRMRCGLTSCDLPASRCACTQSPATCTSTHFIQRHKYSFGSRFPFPKLSSLISSLLSLSLTFVCSRTGALLDVVARRRSCKYQCVFHRTANEMNPLASPIWLYVKRTFMALCFAHSRVATAVAKPERTQPEIVRLELTSMRYLTRQLEHGVSAGNV